MNYGLPYRFVRLHCHTFNRLTQQLDYYRADVNPVHVESVCQRKEFCEVTLKSGEIHLTNTKADVILKAISDVHQLNTRIVPFNN